jgi:hypothetical protein
MVASNSNSGAVWMQDLLIGQWQVRRIDMEEESVSGRAAYADRIKGLIEERFGEGVHLAQIKGEGRLAVMKYFEGELEQAREWVKFLEVLMMYAEAQNQVGRKGFFGRFAGMKELRDMRREIYFAKSEVDFLERAAQRAK